VVFQPVQETSRVLPQCSRACQRHALAAQIEVARNLTNQLSVAAQIRAFHVERTGHDHDPWTKHSQIPDRWLLPQVSHFLNEARVSFRALQTVEQQRGRELHTFRPRDLAH